MRVDVLYHLKTVSLRDLRGNYKVIETSARCSVTKCVFEGISIISRVSSSLAAQLSMNRSAATTTDCDHVASSCAFLSQCAPLCSVVVRPALHLRTNTIVLYVASVCAALHHVALQSLQLASYDNHACSLAKDSLRS